MIRRLVIAVAALVAIPTTVVDAASLGSRTRIFYDQAAENPHQLGDEATFTTTYPKLNPTSESIFVELECQSRFPIDGVSLWTVWLDVDATWHLGDGTPLAVHPEVGGACYPYLTLVRVSPQGALTYDRLAFANPILWNYF